MRDAYSQEAVPLDHILGGNDLLPRAFAGSLAQEIIYGAPVVRIKLDQRGARVVFIRGGLREIVAADSIICTLPFTTLRREGFSPRLSMGKQRAIEGLVLNKLPLQSVKSFDSPISGCAKYSGAYRCLVVLLPRPDDSGLRTEAHHCSGLGGV